jgi:hypothetical protein
VEWRPGRQVAACLQMPAGEAASASCPAPGAGAGQAHHFLAGLRHRLAAAGHPAMTFDYPYVTEGRRAPDRLETLLACHRAAARRLAGAVGGLVLAGKSMGAGGYPSRDPLAPLGLLGPVVTGLPRATLRVLDGGDHSFGVKGTPDERGRAALDRLADWTVEWLAGEVGPAAGVPPGTG